MMRPNRTTALEETRLLVTLTVDELRAEVRAAVASELASQQQRTPNEARRPARLTVSEAAAELRCSLPSVRRLIARGRLRTVRLGHGGSARVLIPRAALEALIAESTD